MRKIFLYVMGWILRHGEKVKEIISHIIQACGY
jgi:hypothetical protein